MKKLLPLFVFFISFLALSQDIKRENINGIIIVEGNDIEGISIFNSTSKIGTVTNEDGEFTIAVALNDLLEIRALEYQNFDVRINKAILESKTVSIFLIEEVKQLEEVVITNKVLTGNLKTDASKANVFKPKLDAIYFGIKNNDANDFGTASAGQMSNSGMHSQSKTMVNGLNVVSVVDQLLIPLFRSEVIDKKAAGVPEVPATSIKYYLGSNFLVTNFNIPEHRVEEFIRFVEEDTFDFDLLNYGHEIEFLELLNKKSKEFLKTTGNKD
jgi:hypothetical protein